MNDHNTRPGGRPVDALRSLSVQTDILKFAEGSALFELGDTRVLAAASVERRVPPFLRDRDQGWVTAEYAMLPRATSTRSAREVQRGRPSGRTSEIQRLIGRSLRSVIDLQAMPGFTLTLDCDVLQADGGTRTASITAAYVAAVIALGKMMLQGDLRAWPVVDQVAAVSVGIVDGCALLDLEYVEDSAADVDLNLVATSGGKLVEIQGTGEERAFSRAELDVLIDLGMRGIGELVGAQDRALSEIRQEVEGVVKKGRRTQAPPKDEGAIWGRP